MRKVGHMGNFYANLLTKNVALGKGPAKPKEEEEAGAQKLQQAQKEKDEEEARLAAAAKEALLQKQKGPVLDKYERARQEAEVALRQRQVGEGVCEDGDRSAHFLQRGILWGRMQWKSMSGLGRMPRQLCGRDGWVKGFD